MSSKCCKLKKNAKIGPHVATTTNLTCARMFGKAWGKFSFRRLDSRIFLFEVCFRKGWSVYERVALSSVFLWCRTV